MNAAAAWSRDLDAWAIPSEILTQASESPWIHPPVLFDVPDVIVDSPSHQRAREVLGESATVLDVGCGPATITADLGELVPGGMVVGVDASLSVLSEASRSAPG